MLQSGRFVQTVREIHGADGEAWLAGLPALLAECARRWSLTLGPPFPDLSYNYVAPAVHADGSNVVLKVGPPCRELRTEAAALSLFDGAGSVRLWDSIPELGALLLERLIPGAMLIDLADEANDGRATSIAASVMRGLWRPVSSEHDFPDIRDWARGLERMRSAFDGGCGPLPATLVEMAEGLFRDLLDSAPSSVLLHGDLHHGNVVSAEREPWLAIDPKGLIGEPAYETGAVLRNLWTERHKIVDARRMLERRVHQFADELQIDRARIRGWGVAQAVLSAWWCIEDGGDGWESSIEIAGLLAAVKI